MATLYAADGRAIPLGPELGRGGEGTVYEVRGSPDKVAKVYHQAAAASKARKLRLMARVGTERLRNVAAWPLTTLSAERNGPVSGLLMPRVQGHRAVHLLYNPRSRLEKFSQADFRFLVHSAMNIARAFVVVHQHGHVIGDVNHSGILVSEAATATLIDCDSFQVQVDGEVYRCEVGVPEYTPSELQGKDLGTVRRTANHDAFGLAVLIFHLLFAGRHPFAGVFSGHGQLPLGKSIKERRFAYGTQAPTRGMKPPPYTPDLEFVSGPIATLFERAFVSENRPRAEEWVRSLETLAGDLSVCNVERSHVYWSRLGSCPWCPIEAALGTSIFPITTSFAVPRRGDRGFDLALIRGQIEAVTPPPLVAATVPTVAPSAESKRLRALRGQALKRAKVLHQSMQAVAVISGAALMLVVSPILFLGYDSLWALVTIVVGWWVFDEGKSSPFKEDSVTVPEIQALQIRVDKLRKQKASTELALDREVYDPFHEKLTELKALQGRLDQVERERRRALDQLREEAKRKQKAHYLRSIPISRCNASGVGRVKLRALKDNGITSAADVERRKVAATSGFGSVLVGRVLAWRREVERNFRLQPARKPDPTAVARIEHQYKADRRKVESALSHGPSELVRVAKQVEPIRAAKAAELNRVLKQLAQAEVDLRSALS